MSSVDFLDDSLLLWDDLLWRAFTIEALFLMEFNNVPSQRGPGLWERMSSYEYMVRFRTSEYDWCVADLLL